MLVVDCGDRLDERGRHYLRRIEVNIAQMERLITDVLALSRVGRDARPCAMVSLAEIVDEVLAGLGDRIRAAEVTVTRRDLGAVWGIRTELQQVVSNLVGNAVKYIGDTPDPRIEIGAAERAGWLECYVRDNGIGIDPAYHQQVFEVFQRLKEITVDGTGVGLAIVKKIVEAMGGRVWVESAKGRGATFTFTWPTQARPR
jgi:signal transduction histidine kinase